MKKILFCAGILALAASCAENEIDSISGQKEATKGISFEGALVETPTTRGDLAYDDVSGIHNFFWYAEKDQLVFGVQIPQVLLTLMRLQLGIRLKLLNTKLHNPKLMVYLLLIKMITSWISNGSQEIKTGMILLTNSLNHSSQPLILPL